MAAKHVVRRKMSEAPTSKAPPRTMTRMARRQATASEVKQLGWRGILELARQNEGQLAITNHSETQGVVLTREAFEALQAKARASEDVLTRSIAELSAQFDARLANLEGAKGAHALRAAISSPANLHGKVKAGDSH